jgi:hypothetical protein
MNSLTICLLQQKGQAALWFLALMASMAMVFVGVYSVGQATSEKQKITNAADAAAYSGGLVQARALNMMAYGNRAEIANEVLIAQAVSLHSWTAYNEKAVENARTVMDILAMIPVVNFVAAPLAQILSVMEQVLEGALEVVSAATDLVIPGVEFAYDALDVIAGAIFTPGVMTLAATDAANAVLAQNYLQRTGSVDLAPTSYRAVELGVLNTIEWQGAFAKYSKDKEVHGASDGRQTAKDILLNSRDSFSTARQGPNSWPLSLIFGSEDIGNCFTGSIGSSRDGPTELKDFDRWEAQDTSEFEYRPPGSCFVKGGGWVNIPFGWGRATAANESEAGDMKTSPHYLPGLFAYEDMEDDQKHSGWSGVKELYDVERETSNGRPVATHLEDRLVFHFAAKKAKGQVRTNDTLGYYDQDASAAALGNTKLVPDLLDNQVASIAAAKVFFARPVRNSLDFTGLGLQREDAHKEIASLYNPYWQVRLTAPSVPAMAIVYGGSAAQALFSQSR